MPTNGLGSWPFWVLNDRHFGQFRNLSKMPRDHRWHAWDRNKHLWSASHLHLRWKTGSFMQEKRQRLNGLAQSHQWSENTWETSLQFFTSQIPQPESKQVWKSYADFPHQPSRPCVLFLYHKKSKSEKKSGYRYYYLFSRTYSVRNMWYHNSHVFCKEEVKTSKCCSI